MNLSATFRQITTQNNEKNRPSPIQNKINNITQQHQWRIGDLCLAEYWEDGEYHGAIRADIRKSGHTAVVEFLEHGNYEEVHTKNLIHTFTIPFIKDLKQPANCR